MPREKVLGTTKVQFLRPRPGQAVSLVWEGRDNRGTVQFEARDLYRIKQLGVAVAAVVREGSEEPGEGFKLGNTTGYLRMRGLPFSSTKKDIATFFKDYKTVEDSIVLTYRSDGRATGEGYVAFESPDEAKKAMALHRNSMGSRYIELFISNKEEHGRALTRFGGRTT